MTIYKILFLLCSIHLCAVYSLYPDENFNESEFPGEDFDIPPSRPERDVKEDPFGSPSRECSPPEGRRRGPPDDRTPDGPERTGRPNKSGRPGRHGGPPRKTCCKDKFVVKINDVKKECIEQVMKNRNGTSDQTNCRSKMAKKGIIDCVSECIMKKKGMAGANGELLSEKIKAFLKNDSNVIAQSWQIELVESVTKKCLQQNTSLSGPTSDKMNVSKGFNQREESSMVCNPTSSEFVRCFMSEMQLACPQERIDNQRHCQMMKERQQRMNGNNDGQRTNMTIT